MTPAPIRRLALALAVLVLLMSTGFAGLQDKRQQLQGINGQIAEAKTRLKSLQDQEREVRNQLVALDGQLARIAATVAVEQDRLEALRRQIEDTRAQLAAKEDELARHILEFGDRMRFMYKSGRSSGLQLVFAAANFSDMMNRVHFFNDVVRQDRRDVDQLKAERATIRALKADLEAKATQQASLVKRIKDEQAQLESTRAQRAAREQQLADLTAQLQRELDEMEAQRAAIQAEIARLLAESLRARSSGKWIWPVDGRITQGFGCVPYVFEPYEPSCPTKHFHSGVDIANDLWTPVHAADGGIVHNYATWCSWNPRLLCGYGRYVIIVHAGGFISLYGHLADWAVPDGIDVRKDAVIGYMGSSGASTGSHLHFEIDLWGAPVNPLNYLP